MKIEVIHILVTELNRKILFARCQFEILDLRAFWSLHSVHTGPKKAENILDLVSNDLAAGLIP